MIWLFGKYLFLVNKTMGSNREELVKLFAQGPRSVASEVSTQAHGDRWFYGETDDISLHGIWVFEKCLMIFEIQHDPTFFWRPKSPQTYHDKTAPEEGIHHLNARIQSRHLRCLDQYRPSDWMLGFINLAKKKMHMEMDIKLQYVALTVRYTRSVSKLCELQLCLFLLILVIPILNNRWPYHLVVKFHKWH